MSDFDRAFDHVVGVEGGYVNHPDDPGGETNWGVSKRSYPNVNIKTLTKEGSKAIYRRDFWNKVRGDELPWPVSFNAFDAAVNSGVDQAVRWLQRAASTPLAPVADDGRFGPITLAAALRADPDALSARLNGQRLQFMTDLSTWGTFGRGWARRIAGNLLL